jgi:hypothetical protein
VVRGGWIDRDVVREVWGCGGGVEEDERSNDLEVEVLASDDFLVYGLFVSWFDDDLLLLVLGPEERVKPLPLERSVDGRDDDGFWAMQFLGVAVAVDVAVVDDVQPRGVGRVALVLLVIALRIAVAAASPSLSLFSSLVFRNVRMPSRCSFLALRCFTFLGFFFLSS